jgi:uncharacterized protein YjdB
MESEVSTITFASDELVLNVGNSTQIQTLISPNDADDKPLVWSSSDETVASVSDGKVKGISKGEAEITAMSSNGIKATCSIVVNDIEPTKITLNQTSIGMKVGDKNQITAKVTPPDASQEVTWSSSNTSVAYVDNNGNITALKAGYSNISCETGNSLVSTCLVKVTSSSKKTTTQNPTTVVVVKPNSYSSYASGDDYIIDGSDIVKLNSSDIAGMDNKTLQMAINEIYARHGRPFVTQSVSDYFMSKSWYTVNSNYSDSSLTDIDLYNINFLKNAMS